MWLLILYLASFALLYPTLRSTTEVVESIDFYLEEQKNISGAIYLCNVIGHECDKELSSKTGQER